MTEDEHDDEDDFKFRNLGFLARNELVASVFA